MPGKGPGAVRTVRRTATTGPPPTDTAGAGGRGLSDARGDADLERDGEGREADGTERGSSIPIRGPDRPPRRAVDGVYR